MSDTSIKTAQVIGILGSAFAAGGIFTITHLTIPTLLLHNHHHHHSHSNPQKLATQWLTLYNKGKSFFPVLTATASLAHGYLAWFFQPINPRASTYYLGALVASIGIVPYTLLVMGGTNRGIEGYASTSTSTSTGLGGIQREGSSSGHGDEDRDALKMREREREDEKKVVALMKKWAVMNLVRSLGPLVGAGLAVYAAVSF